MKNLLILGAGGFGREVLAWARGSHGFETAWTIGGFLDNDLNALDPFEIDKQIVGRIEDYQPQPNDVFVCAIGTPAIRRKCVEQLLSRKAKFISLIHETVVLGERVNLGTGVILCPGCVLTVDISVGDFTALNLKVSVGHDARIGRFCQLSSFVDITGGVVLEDEVFVGSHASILPKVTVKTGATVGAGSAVVSRVPAGQTVYGVPAKKL